MAFLGFMSPPSASAEHHGRFLMASDPLDPQPSKWRFATFVIGLFFRISAIVLIFLKLFVFGEPSLQPDSKMATMYWAFKRKADLTQEKVGVSPVTKQCPTIKIILYTAVNVCVLIG